MNQEMKERLSLFDTERLLNVIINRQDYTPEAIGYVKDELRNRGYDDKYFEDIRESEGFKKNLNRKK